MRFRAMPSGDRDGRASRRVDGAGSLVLLSRSWCLPRSSPDGHAHAKHMEILPQSQEKSLTYLVFNIILKYKHCISLTKEDTAMNKIYDMCLTHECSTRVRFSREEFDAYLERLAWI